MRIAYCVPFFPYLYTPWLLREMACLRDRGHSIAVVSLGHPPGPAADLRDFGLTDVPVLRVEVQHQSDRALLQSLTGLLPFKWLAPASAGLNQRQRAAGFRQGLHEWAMLKQVVWFLKRHRIEVIDAHWAAHSATLAQQVRLATGIPYLVRLHGGDVYRVPSPHLPRILADAGAICPVSGFVADLLHGYRPLDSLPIVPKLTLDPARVRICPNGVPADQIAHAPAAQCNDQQLVVSIGRLEPEKRPGDLITALAALAPAHPRLRLRLIGSGTLEQSLKQQATLQGVANRVEFTGALPWKQVMAARQGCHIYAQVSEVEGCSLATLEGLAAGLPGILTKVGAACECVKDDQNGYTIDVGDVASLTDRLDRLSRCAQCRGQMGAASLQIIRDHFEFSVLMSRLEGIIGAVARGHALPN